MGSAYRNESPKTTPNRPLAVYYGNYILGKEQYPQSLGSLRHTGVSWHWYPGTWNIRMVTIRFTVSSLGSQTYPVSIFPITKCIIEIDTWWLSESPHWFLVLWDKNYYSMKKQVDTPSSFLLQSGNIGNQKEYCIMGEMATIRTTLKDLKDAGVMVPSYLYLTHQSGLYKSQMDPENSLLQA